MIRRRSTKVPGRVTIIGGHTGDNQGVLISIAIPRYVQVQIDESSRGCLSLASDAFPGELRFTDLNQIEPHWAKYVVGALLAAGLSDSEILRLTVQVTSNLPMQRGLASSAALVSATLFAANDRLADLPRDQLLELCANVERRHAGVNCGVFDYYANLFAVKDHLLTIDCKYRRQETIRWPTDISLLVCDTGKPRQLIGTEYNLRRSQCNTIAKAAGTDSLRTVSEADIDRLRWQFPIEAKRADHVLSENQRVIAFAKAVGARDYSAMKALMAAAHHSLAVDYECSSFEQDLLVEEANKHDCCVGSRLTGAGWGGVTIHLVKKGHENQLAAAVGARYKTVTGATLEALLFNTTASGWFNNRQAHFGERLDCSKPEATQVAPTC